MFYIVSFFKHYSLAYTVSTISPLPCFSLPSLLSSIVCNSVFDRLEPLSCYFQLG
jgi:hypothetical protein